MKTRQIKLNTLPFREGDILFDIETTGLSPRSSYIYLIGVLRRTGGETILTQWLAERMSEEKDIAAAFAACCTGGKRLVHFNGTTFDLPFVRSCLRQYSLESPLEDMDSLDLYAEIRHYRKLFGLDSLSLKSMEGFLGIRRRDPFSGRDLIAVYDEYKGTGDQRLLGALFLHNEEDLSSLPAMLQLQNYRKAFTGPLQGISCQVTEQSALFTVRTGCSVPTEVSEEHSGILLHLQDRELSLQVPFCLEELRYYFPDYKNYFYLPAEDMAVHRSVGIYTDRAFRKPATASTAYTRRAGTFLPLFGESSLPVFRHSLKEKDRWICLEDIDPRDPAFISTYVRDFLTASAYRPALSSPLSDPEA